MTRSLSAPVPTEDAGERIGSRVVHLGTVHCDEAELDRIMTEALATVAPPEPLFGRVGPDDPSGSAPDDRVTLLTVADDAGEASGVDPSGPLFGELPRHQIMALLHPSGRASGGMATAEVVRRLSQAVSPFTSAERARISRLNPLVAEVVRRHRAVGVDLSATALVFRDHLLLEKLNILRGLLSLGLPPMRCLVIGKPDPTIYRRRVVADLVRSGVVVVDPAEADFSVDRWLKTLPADCRVVVVDDGGDLAVDVLKQRHPGRGIWPIETTTKGIRVLRAAGLLDQVVNLSDTSIKDAMNRRIAVSCVYRLREILRHEAIEDQGCIVVGYGRLGRSAASLLAGMGMTVRVAETDRSARRQARDAGFAVFADVLAAAADGGSRFLFGCSGQQAVSMDVVRAMASHPVLATASSQDLQPVLRHLRRQAVAHPVRNVGVRYETPEHSLTVVADGHAVNLYLAEGVSEPDYDPFSALILTAIIEGASALERGAVPADLPQDPELLCRQLVELQRRMSSGRVVRPETRTSRSRAQP
ncbi:hypothetical protein AB0893_17695 [Micromonospora aurantiaca]|uniref:hypothetical protein n=1 Tax=Micromonospora aurantiaca (nom. illeg.) TaxID=47850 RepID=UPI003452F0F0